MKKKFIIRVRLENATDNQYVQFSNNMTNSGYSTTIIDKNGQRYYLPLGNFKIDTADDKYKVLEHIKNIVLNSWDKKFQILVTESSENVWTGLAEY